MTAGIRLLQLSLNWTTLRLVKENEQSTVVREGTCAHPGVCPLSQVRAGTVVCIKHLSAATEVKQRLREMGFYEEQTVKLLSSDGNLICQVCDARLGISAQLGESIMVEKPLPHRLKRR